MKDVTENASINGDEFAASIFIELMKRKEKLPRAALEYNALADQFSQKLLLSI